MSRTYQTDLLVIGVGNEFRGDDAVGRRVAQALQKVPVSGVTIAETDGEVTTLVDLFRTARQVVVIDACRGQERPGQIRRFDLHDESLPTSYFHCSSHAFGVAEAVELARALGCFPERLVVYAIEGKAFAPGCKLSPEVEAAIPEVIDNVLRDVQQWSGTENESRGS
jgi:hydrogenase maturation protease